MAICRYWQQGQCRFGNDCRFEHSASAGGGFGGQRAFGGGGMQGQQQDITNQLVQTVKQDMEQWEKGNQWSFSCYAPAKETACFPGLDDISPEEMRLEAYTALSSGTVDQYQRKVQSMAGEYAAKRRMLHNPTEQVKDVLRNIYNKVNVQNVNVFSSGGGGLFGGPPSGNSVFQSNQATTPSVFGGGGSAAQGPKPSVFGGGQTAAQTTSVFGKPAGSIFGGGGGGGGGTNLFGSSQQPQQSLFGQSLSAAPVGGGSLFGQPATFGIAQQQPPPPAFGQATQQSSVFGQSSMTNQPPAAFGTSTFGQPASVPSPFGQSTAAPSTFGQSTAFGQPSNTPAFGNSSFGNASSSVFGAPAATSPSSTVFGVQTAASPFAAPSSAVAANPFQSNPQAAASINPFGSPPASSNPFGSTPAMGGSLFGQPVGAGSVGLFGKVKKPQMDSSVYTPIAELTEEEKGLFMADRFILGKIPERPPCKEMCV